MQGIKKQKKHLLWSLMSRLLRNARARAQVHVQRHEASHMHQEAAKLEPFKELELQIKAVLQ